MSAGDLWPCEKDCVYPGPMEVAVIRRRSEIVRRVIFSRKGWDRKSFGFTSSGGGGHPTVSTQKNNQASIYNYRNEG